MGYKQSRKSVLDKNEQLGTRYLRFLRCVSHHLKKNECFQVKLHSLDSGFKTELDPEIAAGKLVAALEKLENNSTSEQIGTQGNISLTNKSSMFVGYDNLNKLYRFFKWDIYLKINKRSNENLTRKEVKSLYKEQYSSLEPIMEIEKTI